MKKKITMTTLTILLAVMLVAIMPVQNLTVNANQGVNLPDIISEITIAAPWDSNVTFTFTDVYALATSWENQREIWGTLESTVVISRDINAIPIGGGSDEIFAIVAGTHNIVDINNVLLVSGYSDSEGEGWIAIRAVNESSAEWLFSYESQRTFRDIRELAVGGQMPPPDQPIAPSPGQTNVTFNGQALNFDLPIINRGGRTFYPMRELLEAIGAAVEWDQATNTAVGVLDGNMVAFPIDSNTFFVNGQARQMDDGLTSFLEDGRTYIPVRFAAEGLGLHVEWDAVVDTIRIYTAPARA